MISVRGVPYDSTGVVRISERSGGIEYLIMGKLEDTIRELAGYELWIWGERSVTESGYPAVNAKGYELIGPLQERGTN
ncbi:MAG: hypothetical protein GF417_09455 [Candidatus Latescibacteria bacterium]|nr:hypothetical protein [Candidatus Latescibacterota bacterium]